MTEPMLLLHGVMGSSRMWREVTPLLSKDFDVITPNALGHAGGRPVTTHPVEISDVVDDAERILDELGHDTAHLVGNSMGGWVALELARRGRGRSVCALSPAGMWPAGARDGLTVKKLRAARRDGTRSRPLLPLALKLPQIRKYALSSQAVNGARVPAAEIVAVVDDMLACTVAEDLLATSQAFSLLDPLPCPVTVAWSAADQIFPADVFEPRARALLPGAHFLRLANCGHVPMFDNPALVASTIVAAAGELSS